MGKTTTTTIIRLSLATIAAAVLAAGCGEEHETNVPATPLSASKVTSATTDGHAHTVSIPFTDLATTLAQTNYQSSSISDHSHTIALSASQFTDLNTGMQVKATSTTTNGHSHEFTIQGGALLYESLCYNCHSDEKRGTRGMDDRPQTTAQRDAIKNPNGMAFSTAAPPDPNVTPPPPEGQADGAALYAANCAGCHGALATSSKRGKSAAKIKSAIAANKGGMGSLAGLNDAQIQAIATTLQ